MTAKVISGEVFGVKGPIEAKVPTYFLDFYLNKDKQYDHPIPKGWNSMIIVHQGSLETQGSKTLKAGDCAVYDSSATMDQQIRVKALEDNTAFVLLAGLPINEPISRRGPFVLNTPQELKQTFYDYSTGSNGFEGSQMWESKNQHMRNKK
jgi:redox-sensitive bicupin YhaK (pirin superfamily)